MYVGYYRQLFMGIHFIFQLTNAFHFILKTEQTRTTYELIRHLIKCQEQPSCYGIYSMDGKIHKLNRINLKMFKIKSHLFLQMKYNFIYDDLLKYEKFGSLYSNKNNYIK
ncbi:hypothetical protein SNEBB_000396 [Seison nebaliae]|nr:hypothetical protein SNEBB_000396 [Seison nebaliae]